MTGTDVLTLTCAEVIFKSCVSSVVETNYSKILSLNLCHIHLFLTNQVEYD